MTEPDNGPPVRGQIPVEYVGGPFDGRRERVPPEPIPSLTAPLVRLIAGYVDDTFRTADARQFADVGGYYLLVGPTQDGAAYVYVWNEGDPGDVLDAGADADAWVPAPWNLEMDGGTPTSAWLWHRVKRGGPWPRPWATWCGRNVHGRTGLIPPVRERPPTQLSRTCATVQP